MRKLFVSFTGTIRGLSKGTVTQQDLDTGIFYFGCAKIHACAPWKPDHGFVCNELTWFFKDEEGKFDADAAGVVHRALVAAIEKAESDGRVAWRENGLSNTYGQLSELLAKNGFGPITGDDGRACNGSYCYPGVKDRIKEAGLPLDVIS